MTYGPVLFRPIGAGVREGVGGMDVSVGAGGTGVFVGGDGVKLGRGVVDCVTVSPVELVSETGATGVETELHEDNKSKISDRRIVFILITYA